MQLTGDPQIHTRTQARPIATAYAIALPTGTRAVPFPLLLLATAQNVPPLMARSAGHALLVRGTLDAVDRPDRLRLRIDAILQVDTKAPHDVAPPKFSGPAG